MNEIQKADAKARLRAVIVVVIGTVVGAALILGFENYRTALQEWILSGPAKPSEKIKWISLAVTCVLSAPLIGLGAYFWVLGARVARAQQYPLPAQPVIRDTPIVRGKAAVLRGNILKVLAVCIFVVAIMTPVLFWRVALLFTERAH